MYGWTQGRRFRVLASVLRGAFSLDSLQKSASSTTKGGSMFARVDLETQPWATVMGGDHEGRRHLLDEWSNGDPSLEEEQEGT